MFSRIALLTAIFASFFWNDAHAQTITTTQALDFGEIVVRNNNAQREINLQSTGAFTADGEIVFLSNPQEGIYSCTGFPPATAITSVTVTVTQQVVNIGGSGPNFTIDNFDIDAPANTGTGNFTINLGARLRTSGNGVHYEGSEDFDGIMDLTVNY